MQISNLCELNMIKIFRPSKDLIIPLLARRIKKFPTSTLNSQLIFIQFKKLII